MSRRLTVAALSGLAIALAACADPVAPELGSRGLALRGTFDEYNRPTVRVCKYEFENRGNLTGVDFTFEGTVSGGSGYTTITPIENGKFTFTLKVGECKTVWTAGYLGGNSVVTITEVPPQGTFAYLIAYAYQTHDQDNYYLPYTASVPLQVGENEGAYVQFINKGSYTPPPPPSGPGARTPGYWKNDKKAWPAASVTIGGIVYTRARADALMEAPTSGDKTYNMFEHLVAAKLNLLAGTSSACIAGTIAAADAWMAAHPVGSGVTANSAAWKEGEPLHSTLDAYNNGALCAPAAD